MSQTERYEELREELQQEVLDALYSRSPATVEGLVVRPFGDMSHQTIRYYLYIDVVEELVKAARYRDEAATAVLLGQFCIDARGPFIEVVAFRGMEYLYGADRIDRTRPALEQATERAQQADNGEAHHVVGVFSAQPGTKALLDKETARLHLSLFNLPYQVALVIDGRENRLGLYARRRGGGFFNAAFYVVEPKEKERQLKSPSPADDAGVDIGDDDDEDKMDVQITATSEGDKSDAN